MTRLVAFVLAANIILLPVYALYLWAIPGRASARFQWRLHRIAFLLAVVLPFVLLVPLRLPTPPAVQHLASSISFVSAPALGQKAVRASAARKAGASFPPSLLLLIPAGGALVFYARLGRQKVRERILAQRGVRRRVGRVEVIVTGAARVPFSTGFLRPRIFLPADIAGNPRAFPMVFGHEAIHLRRAHWLWTMCESLFAHVFWFNPMMHVLARGGGSVRELLCDAEVCRTHPPAEYGQLLLETAAGARGVRLASLVDAWIQRGTLKERIRFLVQGGRSYMGGRVRAASIGAGVLAVALLLAGLPFVTPAFAEGPTGHDRPDISAYPPVPGVASVTITSTFTGTVGMPPRTGLFMFDSVSQAGITFGGMDFHVLAPDTEAVASADGFVEDVFTAADGTMTVSIVTASGYRVVYSHLAKALVTYRSFVRAGQALGTLAPAMGEFSLHYEVWKDGRQVDPFPPSVYDISSGGPATMTTTFSGTGFSPEGPAAAGPPGE